MAKRKPDPSLAGQLDMFCGLECTLPKTTQDLAAANDTWSDPIPVVGHDVNPTSFAIRNAENSSLTINTPPSKMLGFALADEWWTLNMVCAYLKIGRKAVWERKRDPQIGFPKAVSHGSNRPRWRSREVRAWAEHSTQDQLY